MGRFISDLAKVFILGLAVFVAWPHLRDEVRSRTVKVKAAQSKEPQPSANGLPKCSITTTLSEGKAKPVALAGTISIPTPIVKGGIVRITPVASQATEDSAMTFMLGEVAGCKKIRYAIKGLTPGKYLLKAEYTPTGRVVPGAGDFVGFYGGARSSPSERGAAAVVYKGNRLESLDLAVIAR